MRGPTLIVLTCALLTTGCIGLFDDSEDLEAQRAALASAVEAYALPRLVQDHEHALGDEHTGQFGLALTGFGAGRDGAHPDGETYSEVAVKGGYAYQAFGPRAGFVNPGDPSGVIVFELGPDGPVEVSRWAGQPASDVEVSNDGNWLFVSTQRNGYPYPYTINPELGPNAHLPRGTVIVDVSDKTDPVTMGFFPLPTNGPHTITYVETPDGRELVVHATYDFLFTTYPDNLGQNTLTQKVVIAEFVRAPTPHLEPLSTFQIVQPDEGELNFFPHDATVHLDPATDRLILDVAYWDLGLVTVDITDPSSPVELARFADTGPSAYTKTHLVRVFPGTIDGRVVGVLEPELASGGDDGQYTFVDLTDPADPQRLGHWSLPGEHAITEPFIFSPHNFDLACAGRGQPASPLERIKEPCETPTVVLGHFHGGLWTLDASDPMDPQATGFFFPHVERADMGTGFPHTGFFGAYMVDGKVYGPEWWSGLYELRPERSVGGVGRPEEPT